MEKKSKKSIIIGLTLLLLVTLILLGLTYAYYRTRVIGNQSEKSVSVTSKLLEVTYSDDSAVITASNIGPGYTTSKTFSVENTGNETVNYTIILDNVENNFKRTEDWTYTLTNTETNEKTTGNIFRLEEQTVLGNIQITADEINNYELTILYADSDEDQSEDMGKSLSFRINIKDVSEWDKASDGTLLYALRENNEVVDPVTVPGKEASGANEAILATTEDDYGTSYYFRGNVKNNFINYSGMCWRIVRVQGDGTIKLILSDRDHECSADVAPNSEGVYTGYNSANGSQAFIAPYEQKFYYSISDSRNSETGKQILDSFGLSGYDMSYKNGNVKIILEAWRDGTKYSYGGDWNLGTSDGTSTFEKQLDLNQVVSTDWCNDLSAKRAEYFTDGWYGDMTFAFNSRTITLKCNMVGVDFYIDDEVAMKTSAEKIYDNIGLLTADEVAFSGAAKVGPAPNSYLSLNFTESDGYQNWWVMTPNYATDTGMENHYLVNSEGRLSSDLMYDPIASIRPAIVLKSDVKVTTNSDTATYGEPGTQGNPYVVI